MLDLGVVEVGLLVVDTAAGAGVVEVVVDVVDLALETEFNLVWNRLVLFPNFFLLELFVESSLAGLDSDELVVATVVLKTISGLELDNVVVLVDCLTVVIGGTFVKAIVDPIVGDTLCAC